MEATNITDIYMTVLSALSRENKIILATKLLNSASIPNKNKERLTLNTRFSGKWGEEGESANMVAEELHKDRIFNRNVETW